VPPFAGIAPLYVTDVFDARMTTPPAPPPPEGVEGRAVAPTPPFAEITPDPVIVMLPDARIVSDPPPIP
jgi:hypothetical protein